MCAVFCKDVTCQQGFISIMICEVQLGDNIGCQCLVTELTRTQSGHHKLGNNVEGFITIFGCARHEGGTEISIRQALYGTGFDIGEKLADWMNINDPLQSETYFAHELAH